MQTPAFTQWGFLEGWLNPGVSKTSGHHPVFWRLWRIFRSWTEDFCEQILSDQQIPQMSGWTQPVPSSGWHLAPLLQLWDEASLADSYPAVLPVWEKEFSLWKGKTCMPWWAQVPHPFISFRILLTVLLLFPSSNAGTAATIPVLSAVSLVLPLLPGW